MIPKLEVSGVSYSYHSLDGETLALSDISFTVDTGEFLAIVGPSGCGKSTLLTMLCGLTTPDSGAILLDGKPLTRDFRRTTCSNGAPYFPTYHWALKFKSDWTNLPSMNFRQ